MLFTEFKNYAKENIINYLTPDYEGADIKIRNINKSNGYSYEALFINKPDEKCSIIPALDLTRAYKEYQQGADLDDILEKLADIRMNAKLDGFNKESILTFEGIKSHILPRLINTANNATYLKNNTDGFMIFTSSRPSYTPFLESSGFTSTTNMLQSFSAAGAKFI